MNFIKAQDLKAVSDIINELQRDAINSAINGFTETQDKHSLTVDPKIITVIEKCFIDAGYNVYLDQAIDIEGSNFTLITLTWGE